jgi:hypothetical protein
MKVCRKWLGLLIRSLAQISIQSEPRFDEAVRIAGG